MTIILSSKGIRLHLGKLCGEYKTPASSNEYDDGSMLVKGWLSHFEISEQKNILARVGMEVFTLDYLLRQIVRTPQFPWIGIQKKPACMLRIESGERYNEEGDVEYIKYPVLDEKGTSLRQQVGNLQFMGYGLFLQTMAKSSGFDLKDDIIEKVFGPLEEKVRQHYFS